MWRMSETYVSSLEWERPATVAERMDLGDVHVRLAREMGARFVVSSDAHSIDSFDNVRWSVSMARRGWLTPADVLNTYPLDALRASLRRHARQ